MKPSCWPSFLPAQDSGEPLRFIDFVAPIHAADGRLFGGLGAYAHWSWVTEAMSVAAERRDNDQSVDMANRTGRGFSLLLLNADHFKQVDDNHGHKTGVAVLQQLAPLIAESTRSTDFVARYGGEEFVIILPETSRQSDARAVAEIIRLGGQEYDFPECSPSDREHRHQPRLSEQPQ